MPSPRRRDRGALRRLALVSTAAAGAAVWQAMRRRPTFTLRGRAAIVTGGSRGLGFAIARELLREGAHVALCARDEAEVRAAVRALEPFGDVYGQVCDVTDAHAVEAFVAEVGERYGAVDVVVNNAGQMTVGPLAHMTREDFEAAMDVHYRGALNVILAVLPGMRWRRRGRIVNVASIGGLVPVPHMAPYVASKFALVGLSRALREELAASGVRVTTVCPGPMRTGSPLGARFKGRHREEFAWFGAADALPLLSAGAAHAARRIVQAARSGEAEVVIGAPARVLRLLDGIAPGLTNDVLALVERFLLPTSGGVGERAVTGAESTQRLRAAPVVGEPLLQRIERAADELQTPH